MAAIKVLLLIFKLPLFFSLDFANEKPVAQLEWQGRCTQHKYALNDCNWCRCTPQHKYTCSARVCTLVDKFGHFNDAIRDIDVGMEGKGSWRTTETACEPGVQYRRAGLLCVCTDDGSWPNPVCRDTFRILHPVELTGDSEVTGQNCSPTKLYLIGCSVCFCPSSGQLDPKLCTENECTANDPVLKAYKKEKIPKNRDVEIYAECQEDNEYKLGCRTCHCLRNNRLDCGNCTVTEDKKKVGRSFCGSVPTGKLFSKDCNLCYCDTKGFAYCTAKKCLPKQRSLLSEDLNRSVVESFEPFDEVNCIPGHSYKVGCNSCFCKLKDGKKYFGCTIKLCSRNSKRPVNKIHVDCVKGTFYELNCLICQCDEVKGVKTQLCWVNPECTSKEATRETRSWDLDSLHGYCEPLHTYKRGCNTCHCLSDGKTVKCTSYVCSTPAEPISAEIVPVAQTGQCPKGLSYKIDCNYCFCLSNGNALCTTHDCTKPLPSNKINKITFP